MLKVKIDLVSAVSKSRSREMATMEIANVGGSDSRGSYRYTLRGKKGKLLAEGWIENFPRKTLLACDLVMLCLLDARGERVKSCL